MAATVAGSGNDNAGLETALNTVQNNMRVTVNGGKLNLNTSEFWLIIQLENWCFAWTCCC